MHSFLEPNDSFAQYQMKQLSTRHHPSRRQVTAFVGPSAVPSTLVTSSPFALNQPRRYRSQNTRTFKSQAVASIALLACLFINGSAAINQKHCSGQNTGTLYRGSDKFQSTGLCHDACLEYAFGVVRGHDCWCANYVPNPKNNKNDCNVGCPGIDKESCGNKDTGSYGYIAIPNRKPKGTAGPKDQTVVSTVSEPKTSTSSPRPSPDPTSKSVVNSVATITISTSSMASSSSSQTTEAPTPTEPWTSVITVDGPPITVTFTPSGWVQPTHSQSPAKNERGGGFFSDTGRVAGVFTVLALLIIALLGALFWFMRRRRQKGVSLSAESPTPDQFGSVLVSAQEKRTSRSMSTLGLASAAYSPADKHPPMISMNSGSSGVSGALSATPDRVTDQRLDPGQVWMRFENDNASRMSVRSLRDDQDYSRRVLRLANPDDE